jgi:hypothetical protein
MRVLMVVRAPQKAQDVTKKSRDKGVTGNWLSTSVFQYQIRFTREG